MSRLIPGKYQYTYNMEDGDVRVFDVFHDGTVREKVVRTGEIHFVKQKYAIEMLDKIIVVDRRRLDRFSNAPLYGKIYMTKLQEHLLIRKFIEDNPGE